MREQFGDAAVRLGWQTPEHVIDVCLGVVPVHASRLDQTYHRCRPLARAQDASKQLVTAANGDGPDLVLDPIVINRQLPIINKKDECYPTLEAVDLRLGGDRSVGYLAPLQRHPFVQGVQGRLGSLLPNSKALLGDLALVRRVQIEELAPCVRKTAHLGDAGSQKGLVATCQFASMPCNSPSLATPW